jgi:tetratricopeptide (TPR) repeat protein
MYKLAQGCFETAFELNPLKLEIALHAAECK